MDALIFAPNAWRRVTLARDAMLAGTSHYPYTSSSHDLLSGCKGNEFSYIIQIIFKKIVTIFAVFEDKSSLPSLFPRKKFEFERISSLFS